MKKLILIATALMAVNAEADTVTITNYSTEPATGTLSYYDLCHKITANADGSYKCNENTYQMWSIKPGVAVFDGTSDALSVTKNEIVLQPAEVNEKTGSFEPFKMNIEIPNGYGAQFTFKDALPTGSAVYQSVFNTRSMALGNETYQEQNAHAVICFMGCVPIEQKPGRVIDAGHNIYTDSSIDLLRHIDIYPSQYEMMTQSSNVYSSLVKSANDKVQSSIQSIQDMVKNEIDNGALVQTSVNNFLNTASGNQTNLVNAVSTAMQSARDAAALDTKDYGVNNFYPSMTKQSADGKYLVYPAQSFTLSGGCVLNAAPNNYLTVAHDANQEKNATQLLTAMVLGRRVEITQHQKDLETTDCGVIDSVKILDK